MRVPGTLTFGAFLLACLVATTPSNAQIPTDCRAEGNFCVRVERNDHLVFGFWNEMEAGEGLSGSVFRPKGMVMSEDGQRPDKERTLAPANRIFLEDLDITLVPFDLLYVDTNPKPNFSLNEFKEGIGKRYYLMGGGSMVKSDVSGAFTADIAIGLYSIQLDWSQIPEAYTSVWFQLKEPRSRVEQRVRLLSPASFSESSGS